MAVLQASIDAEVATGTDVIVLSVRGTDAPQMAVLHYEELQINLQNSNVPVARFVHLLLRGLRPEEAQAPMHAKWRWTKPCWPGWPKHR